MKAAIAVDQRVSDGAEAAQREACKRWRASLKIRSGCWCRKVNTDEKIPSVFCFCYLRASKAQELWMPFEANSFVCATFSYQSFGHYLLL